MITFYRARNSYLRAGGRAVRQMAANPLPDADGSRVSGLNRGELNQPASASSPAPAAIAAGESPASANASGFGAPTPYHPEADFAQSHKTAASLLSATAQAADGAQHPTGAADSASVPLAHPQPSILNNPPVGPFFMDHFDACEVHDFYYSARQCEIWEKYGLEKALIDKLVIAGHPYTQSIAHGSGKAPNFQDSVLVYTGPFNTHKI